MFYLFFTTSSIISLLSITYHYQSVSLVLVVQVLGTSHLSYVHRGLHRNLSYSTNLTFSPLLLSLLISSSTSFSSFFVSSLASNSLLHAYSFIIAHQELSPSFQSVTCHITRPVVPYSHLLHRWSNWYGRYGYSHATFWK